ncbi:hypothetical protein I3679_002720 [Proteus mirabilis]|uniref:Uncharacterized protein n=1 Tax=Proteus mirabilis TaxID=584 RepID=A0ABD5LW52_PROMI
MWRWIVAASFVAEQADNNGTHQVDNGRGKTITAAIYRNKHAALTVYAASERMLLANHIEGAAYEHYGAENGAIMAVKIYRILSILSLNAVADYQNGGVRGYLFFMMI